MDITIYGDWIYAYWYTTFRKESKDMNAICSEFDLLFKKNCRGKVENVQQL